MRSLYPPTDPAPKPGVSPSRAPAGSTLPSWAGAIIAVVTAVGTLLGSLQNLENARAVQRSAYETLRQSSAEQSARLAELARTQLELRAWVTELAGRLDERVGGTERAIRKAAKPKAAPLPVPTPPPPAPPPPELRPPTTLPSFEELAR